MFKWWAFSKHSYLQLVPLKLCIGFCRSKGLPLKNPGLFFLWTVEEGQWISVSTRAIIRFYKMIWWALSCSGLPSLLAVALVLSSEPFSGSCWNWESNPKGMLLKGRRGDGNRWQEHELFWYSCAKVEAFCNSFLWLLFTCTPEILRMFLFWINPVLCGLYLVFKRTK